METPKTVLITGASSGIGAATAVAAAEAGYDVAIAYHTNSEGAEDTARKVREKGRRAIVIQADISDPEDVERMFDRVDEEFEELGALVNNAGVAGEPRRVDTMLPERIRRVFEVNAIGPFLCARQAALRMAWRYGGQGGTIVNVSSIAARLGSAEIFVDYAASKGAVDVLTLGLGKEMAADKVRVVGVRPGVIDTEIHAKYGMGNRINEMKDDFPMKRPGTAQEVADTILYLMSDKASYITATSIDVAGGR